MPSNLNFTTKETLRKIVSDQLAIAPADVKDDEPWPAMGADSLDAVELVMQIEDEFGIEVPDEEAEALKTINQWEGYVDARVAAKKAAG